jgi:hypothetical protein
MSARLEIEVLAQRLMPLGIKYSDVAALRRIQMTLHRWAELECGIDGGCVEIDEETGRAYWLNSMTGKRHQIANRERGALKRLADIMLPYLPTLIAYHQTDPRGCALYIVPRSALPNGTTAGIDSLYTRGVAVCA